MARSAGPRRRRTAVDLRLVLGVLLVAGSVAGVVGLVNAVDTRVAVYAAGDGLQPGDRVDASDLEERRVSLDGADDFYLPVGEIPDGGWVVTEVVRSGELVPAAAVGTAEATERTAIVVPVQGGVSADVVAGLRVDVWAAAPGATSAEGFGPPGVLAADAIVVGVVEDDGLVAGTGGRAVEVLVDRGTVAELLQAIANGAALAVVAAGAGPAPGGAEALG